MNEEMICRMIARDIADVAQRELAEKLMNEYRGMDIDINQAQICQLLASFFLCTSIKILQRLNAKEKVIDNMCDVCIETAYEMVKIARFTIEREH